MKTYKVVSGLNHAGKHYKAGSTITLSDRQAQYFILGGQIVLPKAAAEPKLAEAPAEPTAHKKGK